MVYDL
jgi:hypothetical protein